MSMTTEVEIVVGATARDTKILVAGLEVGDVQSVKVEVAVNEPTRVHLVLVPRRVKVTGPFDLVSTERAP